VAGLMAAVHLPKTLMPLFAGLEPEQEAEGETVAEALAALDARWPGLLDRLCEPGPALRRHIRVFVDRAPAELDTPVGAGTRVDVLTAITGG
jgi:molybdopterin synthase sulfur carrier subunit